MENVVQIDDLEGLIKLIAAPNSKMDGVIWWRGQETDWALIPKVYRSGISDTENNISHLFRLRAKARYPNCPPNYSYHEWLYLMQHYGTPTRLLDWSMSPLIAAYFAVLKHESDKGKDGVLWALKPDKMNEVHTGKNGVYVMFGSNNKNEEVDKLFEKPFNVQVETQFEVAAVEPQVVDPRILQQQSCFTIHGSKIALNEFSDYSEYLTKFIIPSSKKKNMFDTLKRIGIRERNLFPDLDHLSNDLGL
jgi:hypothetical protein